MLDLPSRVTPCPIDASGAPSAPGCSAKHCSAAAFGLPASEIDAPTRRSPRTARSRQLAMYLAHVACAASLAAVGRVFGRDRTTAGHACRRIEDQRDDIDFDALVASLETYVRESARACCSSECRR